MNPFLYEETAFWLQTAGICLILAGSVSICLLPWKPSFRGEGRLVRSIRFMALLAMIGNGLNLFFQFLDPLMPFLIMGFLLIFSMPQISKRCSESG